MQCHGLVIGSAETLAAMSNYPRSSTRKISPKSRMENRMMSISRPRSNSIGGLYLGARHGIGHNNAGHGGGIDEASGRHLEQIAICKHVLSLFCDFSAR